MKQRLLILGYYGWQNTGDDAMLYALLRELHVRFPLATFIVPARAPCTIPEEVKELVKFVELRPWRMLHEIMKSSVLVMGGGTHIYDQGNLLGRLAVLTGWLASLTFAKISGAQVWLIGIGIEPVQTKWGVFFAKSLLGLADFVSARDSTSFQIVQRIGFKRKTIQSFDLTALLLDFVASSPQQESYGKIQSNKLAKSKTLGLAVLPYFEIYTGDKIKDKFFEQQIAESLNKWLEKDNKNTVCLFITKGASKDHDVLLTNLLCASLTPQERVRLIPYDSDPLQTLTKIGQCDAFIGMRFHSCVFAYLSHVPLLMINYFHKCQALANDIKLPRSALITPDEIMNGLLEERLTLLDMCPGSFIAERPPTEAKKMADKNFPGVLGILADLDDN
jgi:polysaccharide pyruvyl transferase WcaK-like protein